MKLQKLNKKIYELYSAQKHLYFHGWHHIEFVRKKAHDFAEKINADVMIVESAALVHDLNYIIKVDSDPGIAEDYRSGILKGCGYLDHEIRKIEEIIEESHTTNRGKDISPEGMCLSDADSLFKVLPVTPVLFSANYIKQNKVDVSKMAKKITKEQNKLLESGIYFYTEYAKSQYLPWAVLNLGLWNQLEICLKDDDVSKMLKIAKEIGVI